MRRQFLLPTRRHFVPSSTPTIGFPLLCTLRRSTISTTATARTAANRSKTFRAACASPFLLSVGSTRFDALRSFASSSLHNTPIRLSAADRLNDGNPYMVDEKFRKAQQEEDRLRKEQEDIQRRIGEESYNTISRNARVVSNWLFLCAGIVFTIVVVGGVTRLTESGLSIVEWRPVTGMIPPMSQSEWEAEFAKYQKYPEYAQNPDMDLAHFKFIFFWEWAHRVLARSVGIVFGVPLVYFAAKGYFKQQPWLVAALSGCFLLGGAQGALGWYMVKSGLDPKLVEQRKKATVSAYRLAAHLSLALVLFASMLRLGLMLRVTHKLQLPKPELYWDFRWMGRGLLALLSGTIVSGAFVAGLDAGLLYGNEFPFMSGGIFPPSSDVFTNRECFLCNFAENGTAAQLLHRIMAGSTAWLVLGLNFMLWYRKKRAGRVDMPEQLRKAVMGITHAVLFQIALGILTLMFSVPIPVAALHQANAVVTLGMTVRMLTVVGTRGIVRL